MHTEFHPEDPEVLREMKYDRRDIKIPLLTKWTIWILGSCIICFIVAIPVYNYVSSPGTPLQAMMGSKREPAPPSQNHIAPGYPLLQDNISTKVDIQQLRIHEDEVLKTYDWVDQNKGIVRIPVDKAMTIIEKQGVGTGQQVDAVTKGNTIPQNAVGPGSSVAPGQGR